MDDSLDKQTLLLEIIGLAERAGESIMEVYNEDDSGVSYKGDGSPLTRADMAAHHLIIDGLLDLTPDWPALSEESLSISYDTRKLWDRYWLIDPLDGTREFVKGNKEFTVNIALIENGVPVMGVVYAPALDILYYARMGCGALKKENKHPATLISAKRGGHHGIRVAVSCSHIGKTTMDFLDDMGPHEQIRIGSSLKLCLVAEGAVDLYPRLGRTMEWDTAAAQCIVVEAGGSVSDSAGVSLHYNKADLSNPDFFVRGNPPLSVPFSG